jgi:hypothetical protein
MIHNFENKNGTTVICKLQYFLLTRTDLPTYKNTLAFPELY